MRGFGAQPLRNLYSINSAEGGYDGGLYVSSRYGISGNGITDSWANKTRSDVGSCAFDETIDVGETGRQGIWVYGIQVNGGGYNPCLGNATVIHMPSDYDATFTAMKPGRCVLFFYEYRGASFVRPHWTIFVVEDDQMSKQEQTLTGTTAYTKTEGDAPFALDVVLAKGNGTLSYTSSDSSVASVDASGNVTVGKAGTATITVTAAETDSFNATSIAVVVKVKAAQVSRPTTPAKIDIATKAARLENMTVVFSGTAAKPRVLVDGLREGIDFAVSYANNVAIGTATVTVAGKGSYTGATKLSFQIVPGKAAFKKVKAGKKKMTIQVKTQKGGVKYQVSYRTGKDKWKKVTAKKANLTLKKLKGDKKYQVRVRAFKKVDSRTYYGAWSKVKTVKIKK